MLLSLSNVSARVIILTYGEYFPKQSYATITKYFTLDEHVDYGVLYATIERVNDPYSRYITVKVNGQQILQDVISSVTETYYVAEQIGDELIKGSNNVQFIINWGGYSSTGWYLDTASVDLPRDDGIEDSNVFYNMYYQHISPPTGFSASMAKSMLQNADYNVNTYQCHQGLTESDFKNTAPNGDLLWVDSHGYVEDGESQNSVILYPFDPENPSQSYLVSSSDINNYWTQELEWALFLTCRLFEDTPNGWKQNALKKGVHGIFGSEYDTISHSDVAYDFFDFATSGYTIAEAWIEANDNQNVWGVMAVHDHNLDDHLWGYGSTATDCHCKENSNPFDDDLSWVYWWEI